MIVESVKLDQFRNYKSLELEFDSGTNLFYGEQRTGQDECPGGGVPVRDDKIPPAGKDREMIRFGQEEAHICMRIRKGDVPYRIDMHLKKNRSKGIAINGSPVRKASELVGLGNFVFFSPEDLNIIKNGPAERRRFLDMELCQLDRIYLYQLSNYNKLLVQRNRLLKDYAGYPEAEAMLDIMDEQLLQYGTVIIEARERFVRELGGIIGRIHGNLSGNREVLEVTYEKDTQISQFAARIKAEPGARYPFQNDELRSPPRRSLFCDPRSGHPAVRFPGTAEDGGTVFEACGD